MEKYFIELFDGKKRVGKEKIKVDDYDQVLKRVSELIDSPYRIEIYDEAAYKRKRKEGFIR